MRLFYSNSDRKLIHAARFPSLTWGAIAAAVVAVGWLSGCGSSKDAAKGPCDGKQCGIVCNTDAECHAGTYCGPDGKCTAQCAATGDSCGGGLICTPTGRCLAGSMFITGDGGLQSSRDGQACVADKRQGEGLPADIYIMNDQSQSMSCAVPGGSDRWNAMTTALSQFVTSQGAVGLSVGIQYFGLGGGQGSCNAADYVNPDVEIAPLPGNAQAIIDSLGRHGPSTYTPTPAAIDGAIQHAQAWQQAHPDRVTTVVLATDGQPNLCGNAQDRIGSVAASAAAALAANPPLRTYVIGIIGGSSANGGRGCNLDPAPPNKPDLDRVAVAGGTQSSIIVDATGNDTAGQFLDALNQIRDAAVVPCEYVMPQSTPTKQIDINQVNIQFQPSGGTERELLQAASVTQCDPSSGGWYYDNPTAPTKILLCPATCDIVKSDAKAAVNVYIGCRPTQTITR